MKNNKYKIEWEEWRDGELLKITPILKNLGFRLLEKQIHIRGERYVSSGKKLILIGEEIKNNQKVIIKISNNKKEIREIKKERSLRKMLKEINFSYHFFFSPPEILFTKRQGYYIFITRFIEQEKTFLERNLKEQFFLSLKAFELQEGVHATTSNHSSLILKAFENLDGENYINKFRENKNKINAQFPENKELKIILDKSLIYLEKNKRIIELYSNFLTHWDFVPHNIRVRDKEIYLLDHASLRFGNKYEGQARFINFMLLYNRPLEKLLLNYVENNRSSEEVLSLKLMRIFRLGELIAFYSKTIEKADANLLKLNLKRIKLWSYVLEKILEDKNISDEVINNYKKIRDSLRSADEKERQKKLH